ncbi:hypothetical protein Y032_0221g2555 [Ancylostoma ceylanicum]|nr:hypothetical protein Y032_0221g2555 [Ancylostoma ceylanicum]
MSRCSSSTTLCSNESETNDDAAEQAKKEWRSHLFRSLQLALRDVRSYQYDCHERRWVPNKRQSKRTAMDAQLDDDVVQDSEQHCGGYSKSSRVL